MLSISHVATGAFIAVKVTNPYLAIPLILASHYFLDAVPHWDAGTGLSNKSITPRQAFFQEIPDLLFSAILVILLFPLPNPLPSTLSDLLKLPQIWGSFIALLPDFLETPRNFLHFDPKFLRPLNRFHHSLHHSIPTKLTGLLPQLLLLWLLWFFR